MDKPRTFGQYLRQLREQQGLTQKALADRAIFSIDTIKSLELGRMKPSEETCKRLAAMLTQPGSGEYQQFLALGMHRHIAKQKTTGDLPSPLTPLVGREQELGEIKQLLMRRDCRLVTILGVGGVGKTRLALAVTQLYGDSFASECCFVPLAGISNPDNIAPAIAQALGLRLEGAHAPLDQLCAALHARYLLLVLDNMEQVSGGAVVTELLTRAPNVSVLVTSRARLYVPGEWVFELAGLTTPPPDAEATNWKTSAVGLFVQCAERVQRLPDPELHNDSRVARICRALDGIPLAIELAANWLRSLSLDTIASEVEQGLNLLEVGAGVLPDRHRSMRAVFEHSWRLLSAEDQRVLAGASVFRGGFDLEAAREILSASPRHLRSLIDNSLLRQKQSERFEWHELVRQYAAEQRVHVLDECDLLHKHAVYYCSLVEQAEPQLFGSAQEHWIARLESESDNIWAAFAWSQAETGEGELGLRIVGALTWYWYLCGYWTDARVWSRAALAKPTQASDRITGRAKFTLGATTWLLGDIRQGQQHLEQSVVLLRKTDDSSSLAYSLCVLGFPLLWQGLSGQAFQCVEESVRLFRDVGDIWGLALALNALGDVLQYRCNYEEATVYYKESLQLFQLCNPSGIAKSLNDLAKNARYTGNLAQAKTLCEESIQLSQTLNIKRFSGMALCNRGWIALLEQDYDLGLEMFRNGVKMYHAIGDVMGLIECMEGMATLLWSAVSSPFVPSILEAAEQLRAELNLPITPPELSAYQNTKNAVVQTVSKESMAHVLSKEKRVEVNEIVNILLSNHLLLKP